MKNAAFYITDEGKLPAGIRDSLVAFLQSNKGAKATISFELAKDKRSLNQNDFYWTAIVPHVRNFRLEMGDPVSIDQSHEDLLTEFAPVVQAKRLDGSTYIRPMRSKEMSVEQFSKYVTAIMATMAQFGNPVKERF